MIGRNLSVLLPWRKPTGLPRSAKNLHSSCRQCLRSNLLLTVPVKLAYTSYESVKEQEQDVKGPIIIMHGLFGSKNNWNSLSKSIHQKTKRKKVNAQVIAVDARNHGDSPHSSNMSYKDMAGDMVQLLGDLGFGKAVLVGHSMGGSAVMYTALNFPQYVEKLVVVDMSPVRASPNLMQMERIFEAMRLVMVDGSLTLSKARKTVDQQLSKSIKSSSMRQFILTNLVEADAGKYKWRVNLPVLEQAFSTQIAVFPNVGTRIYDGPTLFIGGANSDYIQAKDHKAIKKLFTKAEFHYIDGASHWVHADKPNEFVDLLTTFINYSSL
ncbi:PREDICTED: alpha/beta hydrolase domain-containing protein 11 isoform X1 [Wasmannia auropunctata]|uniref:alpha/beta hydrolase domain-containing protein 11 isoform X1 n=1 Tax=Wasmannia auropunctata TaxID=64793 RepID=UPI0005F0352B|nr:PREDICTED: alpha/beta hydrolase domain-containing protein 11 isoform X1 [Wasmannia auropunctata]